MELSNLIAAYIRPLTLVETHAVILEGCPLLRTIWGITELEDPTSWWCARGVSLSSLPHISRFHWLAYCLSDAHDQPANCGSLDVVQASLLHEVKEMKSKPALQKEWFLFFDQIRCTENFNSVPCGSYLMLLLLFSDHMRMFPSLPEKIYAEAFEFPLWNEQRNGSTLASTIDRFAQRFFFGEDDNLKLFDSLVAALKTVKKRFAGVPAAFNNIFQTYDPLSFATVRNTGKHLASLYPWAVK